uniref:Uncharacterized protein n=1 Tax=Haptolina ericina TaxID=156174 RepID=A0A7S3AVE9_9EUKA
MQSLLSDPQPHASYADSLLPCAPARSQFVFELENLAQMHSNSEIDRKMQRRLAMISGLQAETIKLEKSARAERLNIVKRASDQGNATAVGQQQQPASGSGGTGGGTGGAGGTGGGCGCGYGASAGGGGGGAHQRPVTGNPIQVDLNQPVVAQRTVTPASGNHAATCPCRPSGSREVPSTAAGVAAMSIGSGGHRNGDWTPSAGIAPASMATPASSSSSCRGIIGLFDNNADEGSGGFRSYASGGSLMVQGGAL